MDLAGIARRLLQELSFAMALWGVAMGLDHTVVLQFHQDRVDLDRQRNQPPPAQVPDCDYPERVVPYAALTGREREFWRQLDRRV